MDLNFLYNDGTHFKKLSFTAKDTGVTYNYSSLVASSSTDSSAQWVTVGDTKYYGSIRSKLDSYYFPSALKTAIDSYGGDNVITMSATSTKFHGDVAPNGGYYNNEGMQLYISQDGSYKKVCKFLWTTQLVYEHTPQQYDAVYNIGLMQFNLPGTSPEEFVGDPGNQTGAAAGDISMYGYNSLEPPKMSLWLATMHDDDVNSTTYNNDFPVLIIKTTKLTHSEGGSTTSQNQDTIIVDLRLLTGADINPTEINGSDPEKNSTPNGWFGDRDTTSNSDVITGASGILNSIVNFVGHGNYLYRIDRYNLGVLEECLWSDSLLDKFKDYIYSPSSGILACQALPYDVSVVSDTDVVIQLCGTEAKYSNSGKWITTVSNRVPGLNPTYDYALGKYAWASQQIQQNYTDDGVSPAGIYIKPFFNSFLDFEPYTKIQVRLPYIGTVPIPTSSCMGGYLLVNYITDNRNGNIMAQIYACSKRNYEEGNARGWILVGQWTGNCATPIPLVGNSMGSGDVVGAIKGFASNAAGTILDDSATSLATHAVRSGLDLVTARHEPRIIGTLNSNAGVLGDGTCRVIISRPVDVTPGSYEVVGGQKVFSSNGLLEQKGIASYSGGTVSQYEGITQGYVLGNIDGATEGEMLKIRSLFADGVNIKRAVS